MCVTLDKFSILSSRAISISTDHVTTRSDVAVVQPYVEERARASPAGATYEVKSIVYDVSTVRLTWAAARNSVTRLPAKLESLRIPLWRR